MWERCPRLPEESLSGETPHPMSFRRGSVSYDRFLPQGVQIGTTGDDLWEAFRTNRIAAPGAVAPTQPVVGWIGGRHLLDLTIGWETNGFGGAVLVAMRKDVVRVPAELRRAYAELAEEAIRAELPAEHKARHLTRRERQDVREQAERQVMEEAGRGSHRTMKQTPVLWDIPGGLLLAPAASDEARQQLGSLFKETTQGILSTVGAGELAARAQAGGRRAVDDVEAETFGIEPVEPSVPVPQPSWCSNDHANVLGNEFLVWLWWCSEAGEHPTVDGQIVTVIPERALDLACAWDVTGTTAIRADFPTRLREARRSLLAGKWPRKMAIVLETGGDAFRATIRGETLGVSGLALPRDEDAPADERGEVERRVDQVLTFERALRGTFEQFVRVRLSAEWSAVRREVSRWIHHDTSRAPAVTVG